MSGKDSFEEFDEDEESRKLEIDNDEDLKAEQILAFIDALSPWLGVKIGAIDLTQMARKLQELVEKSVLFHD